MYKTIYLTHECGQSLPILFLYELYEYMFYWNCKPVIECPKCHKVVDAVQRCTLSYEDDDVKIERRRK